MMAQRIVLFDNILAVFPTESNNQIHYTESRFRKGICTNILIYEQSHAHNFKYIN